MVEWFRQSLISQILPTDDIQVIIVDFFHDERRWPVLEGWSHVRPKPNVWNGAHKLTQNDYFAPSSARNTGLCYAKHDWIAYVDDVSVLAPTWLTAVRQAMAEGYIVCGAFRKVAHLEVAGSGKVLQFMDHRAGHDHRWPAGKDDQAVDCAANWLFGCSCAMPVAALEKINGWPETVCDASGVGAEDSFTGLALVKTGHKLKYDRRMFTYESEELHFQEPLMMRVERGEVGTENSMSWAAVRMLSNVGYFDNEFHGFPDIAALRRHILKGGEFPIPKTPEHLWYNGTALSEL